MRKFFPTPSTALTSDEGFTLIELLVVISITAVITVVAVASYPNFANKADFENLVLDVALTIREAQVYGLGVRERGLGADDFSASYGVHFDMSASDSFVFFADENNDGMYDGDSSGELIKRIKMQRGYKVNQLCVDGDCTKTSLDITFTRPNPDALVAASGASVPSYSTANTELISPEGDTKSIRVLPTGQISLQ